MEPPAIDCEGQNALALLSNWNQHDKRTILKTLKRVAVLVKIKNINCRAAQAVAKEVSAVLAEWHENFKIRRTASAILSTVNDCPDIVGKAEYPKEAKQDILSDDKKAVYNGISSMIVFRWNSMPRGEKNPETIEIIGSIMKALSKHGINNEVKIFADAFLKQVFMDKGPAVMISARNSEPFNEKDCQEALLCGSSDHVLRAIFNATECIGKSSCDMWMIGSHVCTGMYIHYENIEIREAGEVFIRHLFDIKDPPDDEEEDSDSSSTEEKYVEPYWAA